MVVLTEEPSRGADGSIPGTKNGRQPPARFHCLPDTDIPENNHEGNPRVAPVRDELVDVRHDCLALAPNVRPTPIDKQFLMGGVEQGSVAGPADAWSPDSCIQQAALDSLWAGCPAPALSRPRGESCHPTHTRAPGGGFGPGR